ncbi:histidine triad nucleotide-binding protein [Nitrospina sp. 32_T5]|uniref:histidine triad nucleotide-binding protein n=1 Tax=unclassified Nitrospina TaxID=2638683 RepID=UPI003F977B3F
MNDCLFCKVLKGDIPGDKVYEDDNVFAFRDINPQAPTHILICPKKHMSTIMDMDSEDEPMIGSIFSVANSIATEMSLEKGGFRLVLNCGSGAGQSVFHVHFHLLAGRPMQWPPG